MKIIQEGRGDCWMLGNKTAFALERLRKEKPEWRKLIDETLRERWTTFKNWGAA